MIMVNKLGSQCVDPSLPNCGYARDVVFDTSHGRFSRFLQESLRSGPFYPSNNKLCLPQLTATPCRKPFVCACVNFNGEHSTA